jgi:RNA polymerase sigma-70 factor (ECF subfamily)
MAETDAAVMERFGRLRRPTRMTPPDDAVQLDAPPVDEPLVARARTGDVEAFLQAVAAHDRALRALAYRLLGDRHAMDDALQDAYVRAYRALPSFEGRSAFGTWLHAIVYRTCLDTLRRRGRHVHVPLAGAAELADPGVDLAGDLATRDALAAALAQLPADQAAAVLLVDAYGLSYDEAAVVLDVAAGTVASRLNRARATLRSLLVDDREAR